MAGAAALQCADPAGVSRLLALLEACRAIAGGVPADWHLALRRRDLRAAEASNPGVAAALQAPEHADSM